MDKIADNKTFEMKVANLIAATRHLEVSQILLLRRLTLADPESRRWASEKQLNVVFTVILTKAVERTGIDRFKDARTRNFESMLPAPSTPDDMKVLQDLAMQMLGPPTMSEAESTQAGFEALLARGPASPPPRFTRPQSPIKEPPPLFAAQLGPEGEKPLAPMKMAPRPANPVEGEEEAEEAAAPVDFPTLFDDSMVGYSHKVLGLFRISGPSKGLRLPFIVSPDFAGAYEDVLRRYVLPQMRSTRHMQTLAINHNWAEVGGDKIIAIIQGSEVNNPVLHNWDSRWTAFRTPKAAAKGGKKPVLKPSDNPWPTFREDATRCNYEPPNEEHLQILQDLIRYDVDAIAKCWKELSQLYEQEFSPNARQEQAREGAFRDGIMKWASKLNDHVGEFLAIRSYFDFPRCDAYFMRKLVNNFGRSDAERRRNAPFLSEFVQGLAE